MKISPQEQELFKLKIELTPEKRILTVFGYCTISSEPNMLLLKTCSGDILIHKNLIPITYLNSPKSIPWILTIPSNNIQNYMILKGPITLVSKKEGNFYFNSK